MRPRTGGSPPRPARAPERAKSTALPAAEWDPGDAARLAAAEGIPRLGDRHWLVLAACREEAARHGRAPSMARLCALTELGREELEHLFPGDVSAAVARIAGVTPATPPPGGRSFPSPVGSPRPAPPGRTPRPE